MRVFVAPLQSERQVTSQAQSAQRVTDLVGVRALVGRRLPHVLDEGVEARVEVVDVGDIADELVEGLAECAVQRWAPRRWALAAGRDDTTARRTCSTLDGTRHRSSRAYEVTAPSRRIRSMVGAAAR